MDPAFYFSDEYRERLKEQHRLLLERSEKRKVEKSMSDDAIIDGGYQEVDVSAAGDVKLIE